MRLLFISLDHLLEMQANGDKFKLVEVLSPKHFKEGHLPGAINIPLDKLEKEAPKKLKKHDQIIVYCASYMCHASTKAARKLLEMGYIKTVDFKGGKQQWIDNGLELD